MVQSMISSLKNMLKKELKNVYDVFEFHELDYQMCFYHYFLTLLV